MSAAPAAWIARVGCGRISGIALDDTFVLNPTTVFNFRYGLARFKVASASDNLGTDLVALGFSTGRVKTERFGPTAG